MLIHYLVKDEPEAARFQSGLFQISGRPKLAALAFPLPIAQAGRSGGKLVLWGQVRPRSGAQTYRVQVRTAGVWRFSGGIAQDERARLLQHRRRRRRGTPSGSSRRRTPRTAPRSRALANAPRRRRSQQDRDRDPGEPQHLERAPLASPRPRLRCVGVERRRRLPGQLVLAFEHLRVVLNLALGHVSLMRMRLASEACALLPSSRRLRGAPQLARPGLFLCACGIVCFLESELGLPPWDVLHQGFAEQPGISFGVANLVVSVVVLALSWRAAGAHRRGHAC